MYPKILDLGPITIHTHGMLPALAFIAGIWLTGSHARIKGIDPDQIWNLRLIVIPAAVSGPRILCFLSDCACNSQNPREIFSLLTFRSASFSIGSLLPALLISIAYFCKGCLPVRRRMVGALAIFGSHLLYHRLRSRQNEVLRT